MITLSHTPPEMIANNCMPFEPTHPGELIRDELENLGMTQAALARQLDVSASLLNEVVNGKRAVNTELALMLEACMGVPAEVWLNLQTDYNMQVARNNKKFMVKLSHIRRIAAVL